MSGRSPLDQVRAAPWGAITLAGFGSTRRRADPVDERRLRRFLESPESVRMALGSCGTIGSRLVTVIAALGGRVGPAELAYQTQHADPTVVAAALDRLEAAGIIARDTDGSVVCTPTVAEAVVVGQRSLADPHAVVNDELATICRTLGIETPPRKPERIDAIRATFADPAERARVWHGLSAASRTVLGDIVEAAGPATTDADSVALSYWELGEARIDVYGRAARHRLAARAEALHALVQRGIVGIDAYERSVWVWVEAWPLIERPIVVEWSVAPRPSIEAFSAHGEPAVPVCVGVLDRALARWAEQPPTVLKNGDPRLGKTDARAAAKALDAEEPTIDVVARLAIQLRLLLENEVGRSGRGRARQIERRWCVDPDLHRAWGELPPRHRWGRLVAEWCRPSLEGEPSTVANRHLVLWELLQLTPDEAYVDDDAFATWFEDQHAPVAHADLAHDAVRELRAMGVVAAHAVGLTALGRAALADPAAVVRTETAEATRAFVQADLTVIAPPDLRHDLVLLLDRIAVIESTGGATTYRLDAGRITRAVQSGDAAEEIVEALTMLAGTSLPDTVSRLVHDSAAGAAAVRLAPAATVVVVDEPSLLTTACAIKALKLTRLAPNVAVTEVALAKVHATLLTKGIAAKITGIAPPTPARSNASLAAEAEREAAQLRADQRSPNQFVDRYASQLEERAAELRDLDRRFAVPDMLTLTPDALAALGEGRDRDA